MALLRTLAGFLVATFVLAALPAVALADVANCSDTPLYRFAGNYDPATPTATGYYSHLDPQGLEICTNPDSNDVRGSFAWAAIQMGDGSGCFYCIIQIGLGACDVPGDTDCTGTSMKMFTAWGRSSSAPGCSGFSDVLPLPVNSGAAPAGSGFHYYRVVRDNTTWRYDHWPKGQPVVLLRQTSESSFCWGDRTAVTFNETHNPSDSLGGTPSNHFNFVSMTRQTTVGGAWSATSLNPAAACDVLSSGVIYHCDITASQAWEAWTDR